MSRALHLLMTSKLFSLSSHIWIYFQPKGSFGSKAVFFCRVVFPQPERNRSSRTYIDQALLYKYFFTFISRASFLQECNSHPVSWMWNYSSPLHIYTNFMNPGSTLSSNIASPYLCHTLVAREQMLPGSVWKRGSSWDFSNLLHAYKIKLYCFKTHQLHCQFTLASKRWPNLPIQLHLSHVKQPPLVYLRSTSFRLFWLCIHHLDSSVISYASCGDVLFHARLMGTSFLSGHDPSSNSKFPSLTRSHTKWSS